MCRGGAEVVPSIPACPPVSRSSRSVPHGPTRSHTVPHGPTRSHTVPHGPTRSHTVPHGPQLCYITRIPTVTGKLVTGEDTTPECPRKSVTVCTFFTVLAVTRLLLGLPEIRRELVSTVYGPQLRIEWVRIVWRFAYCAAQSVGVRDPAIRNTDSHSTPRLARNAQYAIRTRTHSRRAARGPSSPGKCSDFLSSAVTGSGLRNRPRTHSTSPSRTSSSIRPTRPAWRRGPSASVARAAWATRRRARGRGAAPRRPQLKKISIRCAIELLIRCLACAALHCNWITIATCEATLSSLT